MSSTLWAVTLAMAIGQAPCSTCNGGGGYAGGGYANGGYANGGYANGGYANGGYAGGGYAGGAGGYYGGGAPLNAGPYGGSGGAVTSGGVGYQGFYTNSGGTYDQLYPYDYHEPWIRGYWQEMPAYGGFHSFRPYNYKHLLSQSQVAAGWGMSSTTPYSQEYFRRTQPQTSSSSYEQRFSHYRAAPVIENQEVTRTYRRELPQTVPTGLRTPSQNELPAGYTELPSSSTIDPAVYVRQRKNQNEQQDEQLRQQKQKQLQAIQGLTPEEFKRYAAQYQAAQRQAAERR